MVITLVCTFLGEPNNGTSLVAYNLIDALKQKGHEVRVVCCDEEKANLPNYFICKKLKFEPILNAALKRNSVVPAKLTNEVLAKACAGADYVHTFSPLFSASKVMKYCKKNNIPFGAGFHCQAENFSAHFAAMNCPFCNDLIYKIFFKSVYSGASVIHYPTQFIKEYVSKYDKYNIKSYVISNGVDTSLFYPDLVQKDEVFKDKFLIVMSGRICREKNQKSLIKAMKYSKYKDRVYIRFAGKGPDEKKLKNLIRRSGVHADIKTYTHESLNTILRQADLYVHTSKVEIEAISALEALACGVVPLICHSKKSATSKFALSDNNKFEPGNLKDLAAKIDYWFEHPTERKDLAIKYADYVKQFDINKCMDKMNDMICETVKEYGKES